MIAQIGLTVLLLWVIAYAWAEYRRAPLIGTVAVLVATAGTFSVNSLMNLSKSAVAGLALRDAGNPVGYLPGSGTH